MWPSTRPQASALWMNSFRGAMARLRVPLPTSRLSPRGDLRTARGRCGSLHLHRRRLSLPTPCQSPGKSGRNVSAACGAQSLLPPRRLAPLWPLGSGESPRLRCNSVVRYLPHARRAGRVHLSSIAMAPRSISAHPGTSPLAAPVLLRPYWRDARSPDRDAPGYAPVAGGLRLDGSVTAGGRVTELRPRHTTQHPRQSLW